MSETITELKEAEKEAAAQKKSRGVYCFRQDWIPGAFLIGLGTIFLINNLPGVYLHNWWALFIFIPAFANIGRALNKYQRHGRFTRGVRKSLTGGLIYGLIGSAFLFTWDWGFIWPIFLIIIGLGILMER